MWEGVDDGFRGLVQECVEWGRQYRISFGSVHLLQEELVDVRKSIAFRLMRACGAEPDWRKQAEALMLALACRQIWRQASASISASACLRQSGSAPHARIKRNAMLFLTSTSSS